MKNQNKYNSKQVLYKIYITLKIIFHYFDLFTDFLLVKETYDRS